MTIPGRRTFCGAICAAALTLGLTAAAPAAPIVPANPAASAGERAASSGLPIELVQSRGGRPGGGRPGGGRPGGGGHHGGGGWNHGGGGWNHGGGGWNHGGWHGHHRRWYPRYYGGYYGSRDWWPGAYWGGTGLYFGWGIPSYRYDPYYSRAPVYRARPVGNAHVRWCYEHYRSYRAYDNTYQPYNGPRRQCRSPYV